MLCPRHEVEAWYADHYGLPPRSQGDAKSVSALIARLTARDAALREAAAQVVGVGWLAAKAIRTAPLGECPQCRAEGEEERR